jgi:hypothetical protein
MDNFHSHVGIVGDTGESKAMGPSRDSGEEMPLSRASDIRGFEIFDASLIHVSWCDMTVGDQAP